MNEEAGGTLCPVCGGRLVPWSEDSEGWRTVSTWSPWVDCCIRPLERAELRWIDICEDCDTVVT